MSESSTATPEAPKTRTRYPQFRRYHPNKNGTGTALSMNLDATGSCVFMKLAPQTEGTVAGKDATFVWEKAPSVKLTNDEVAMMLDVLCGRRGKLGDDKYDGRIHQNAKGNTNFGFTVAENGNIGASIKTPGMDKGLVFFVDVNKGEATALEDWLRRALGVVEPVV